MRAQAFWECVPGKTLPITLVVYGLSIHKTFATQTTPKDYPKTADVHALRMNYDSGKIDTVSWLVGKSNPANAMTEYFSGATAELLEEILSTERLLHNVDEIGRYGNALDEEE